MFYIADKEIQTKQQGKENKTKKVKNRDRYRSITYLGIEIMWMHSITAMVLYSS